MHPNTDSVIDMYECRFFPESDKKKIYEQLRGMQFLLRSLDESNILCDEKHDIELINSIWHDWPRLKEAALAHVRKLKDAWKQPVGEREEVHYFG